MEGTPAEVYEELHQIILPVKHREEVIKMVREEEAVHMETRKKGDAIRLYFF